MTKQNKNLTSLQKKKSVYELHYYQEVPLPHEIYIICMYKFIGGRITCNANCNVWKWSKYY